MSRNIYNRSFLLALGALYLLLSSCSGTRHLPEGDKLYTGARVSVNGAATVREKKVLEEDLTGLTRPKPNSSFLGMRIKLAIYNMFRNKKPDSFFGRIREKSGEPPVLLSQLDLQQNVKTLRSHLENKGYFRSAVVGDTIVRNKTARATYDVSPGIQYKINSVNFPSDSIALTLVMRQSMDKSLLKVGEPFDLDLIKAERSRIDAFLKERGFYFFSPNFILVKTDTTLGNHLVNLHLTIKPETPEPSTRIYRIKDVFIYADYSLNTADTDTSLVNAEQYRGYYIIDNKKLYKPSLFIEPIKFNSGEVYNRTDHNHTLSRLANLSLFKFVKNRFEIHPDPDSAYLDTYYYLTPFPKKSLRAELTTITRSNNLNGSLISLNWRNRNTFRGGEHLTFNAYVGSDVQFSGALRGYNTYRSGAEINFSIPRFVLLGKRKNTGGYVPRTNLQIGYDILHRIKLYTLNSFRASLGYVWKQNTEKQHELYPISITYAQPLNVTATFDSLIRRDTLLARSIEQQLILGSTYQYNFNQLASQPDRVNAYYLNALVDLSGNVAGLLTGANVKGGKEVLIRNVPFAQYIKTELDGRYYRKVGLYSTWASRLIVGIGIPYGNSVQIPFIKQFFIGGNNSLRGFRSRSVGPGTYRYPFNSTFLPDETGDIKLEFNTEFRPRITGPLYGAIFLDAGNVWLMNDSNYTHKPGGKFTSKFLNQLAVDVGIGFRFDITLFVIRLDIGFPIRKPWEQNPWVLNQMEINKLQWRRENIVYNLGIGYPF